MSAGAIAGGAAAAAIAQASRAMGVIVRVDPVDFLAIVGRQKGALVVHAPGGFFQRKHQYLTSYKGLAFHCASPEPLFLSSDVERVEATKLWVPGA